MTGEKAYTQKALMPHLKLEDSGFNPPSVESYRILLILEVRESSPSVFPEPGDVQVITEVQWTQGFPKERFMFTLRKVGGEWKIRGYSGFRHEAEIEPLDIKK